MILVTAVPFRPGSGALAARRACGSGGRSRPANPASNGATRVWQATSAANGLPGMPTTYRPSGSTHSDCGWPGRHATPSTTGRARRPVSTVRSRSAGPGPVAPQTRTTSAAAASTAAGNSAAGWSGTRSRTTSWAPYRATTPGSSGPMASRTRPLPGSPRWTTSSPVISAITRAGWRTARASRPTLAASATTTGVTGVPAGSSSAPAGQSSPARRTCWPGTTSPVTSAPGPPRAPRSGAPPGVPPTGAMADAPPTDVPPAAPGVPPTGTPPGGPPGSERRASS